MALNTLADIQTKVRRLTRSITTSQLSNTDLNNYINTFVLYDFPEHLRTFNLRKQFTFTTSPGQDTYATDEISFGGVIDNPLYNFQNLYITVHPPVYVAGYEVMMSQSREQFFNIWPMLNSIRQIGSGNGITTTFTGTLPNIGNIGLLGSTAGTTLLQGQVLFNSIDIGGSVLALVDVPIVNTTTGYNTLFGNLYIPGQEPASPPTAIDLTNNINYLTGQYTITFFSPPATGAIVNSQTVPLAVSRPQSMLYYENKFTLRPIPDQAYRVNFEVYVRPTELLQSSQRPELDEWWQYIAFGAARKIFQDRMDMESVQLIEPEYKKQETLCLRRTIVQQTNERTATIYTEQNSWGQGSYWNNGPF